MKFFIFNGVPCAGKSTLIERVFTNQPRYYFLSADTLKWSFMGYNHAVHADDVWLTVKAVADCVCKLEYNIVCDGRLYKSKRNEVIAIVQQYGYEVIEINLEASYDTILNRFTARVTNAKKDPLHKISNTSVERLKELYDIYHSEKNPTALTFDTDQKSVEQLTEQVRSLL